MVRARRAFARTSKEPYDESRKATRATSNSSVGSRTARMGKTNVLAPRIISASGFDELRESLEVSSPAGRR